MQINIQHKGQINPAQRTHNSLWYRDCEPDNIHRLHVVFTTTRYRWELRSIRNTDCWHYGETPEEAFGPSPSSRLQWKPFIGTITITTDS